MYQKEQKWEDKRKSDEKNQERQGLKIIALNQMLSTLPISSA